MVKAKKKKKFQRVETGRVATEDNEGKVIVKVFMECPVKKSHVPMKGNITKSFPIANVRVSEVVDAINAALFEEE